MPDLINQYNAHGALKTPVSLRIVLGYGLRHIALILFPPTRIAFETYTELFFGKLFLIPDLIVALVILLNMSRLPEAANITRRLWHASYWLLISAFALDTVLTIFSHSRVLEATNHQNFGLVAMTLIINLIIITYLLTSKRVRDVFKSFPEAPRPEEPPTPEKVPPQPLPPMTRPRSNIPNATLINEAIIRGYQFSGFPLPAGDAIDPLIAIRQHLTQHNLALAEKGLRYLLQQQPQNPEYLHELALVAFAAEKLPHAEALILKAILFDPNNYLYWRNLGEIRRRLGCFDNAIKDAQKAIALKPDDVNAFYNLGLALWDAGRNDEAMKAFEDAKQRHPDLQKTASSH